MESTKHIRTEELRKNFIAARTGATRTSESKQRMRIAAMKIRETHPHNKLNYEKVKEIRKLLKEGITQAKIAQLFGVTPGTIGMINIGRTWKAISQIKKDNGGKQLFCKIWGGHKFTKWLWAEDVDYACRQCKNCKFIQWGCTYEYRRTFPSALENPKIIRRTKQ